MPSLVREIITPHLSELANRELKVMIDDCGLQERMNLWGDERMEKPGWLEWKKTLEAEWERRMPQGAVPMTGDDR